MKISKIELKDYRAFYGNNYKIDIPNGQNLIIYGENGSGKSSLFQAVSDFFESAVNAKLSFAKHIKAADDRNEQYVKLTFTDYSVQPVESIDFQFSNLRTDTNQAEGQFIAQTFNLKSFLSYKQILKTYLFDTKNNFENHFFDLLVSELIGSINNSFTNNPINQDWQELKENPEDVVLAEQLEKGVNEIINGINYQDPKLDNIPGVNTYLNSYLVYFKQDLSVQLNPCKIEIDNKKINATISLKLTLFGEELDNHIEILNEARLSALALSIYFSAIQKSVALQLKYKILFLDDIFIGLDLSNRIPLLDILRNEFKEYQIFITTYDRHWFETSQRYLTGLENGNWTFIELYQCLLNINEYKSTKPLIVQHENNFTKAIYHLNHDTKPDFPAAANYFRKHIEEIFSDNFFSYELRNVEDDTLIESHKIGKQIINLIDFFRKIQAPTSILFQLQNYLPTLLHPLSHFNLSAPIYKGELLKIQESVMAFEEQISEIKDSSKLIIPPDRKLLLIFPISSTKKGVYEILITDALYSTKGSNSNYELSDSKCHALKTYIVDNGNYIPGKSFKSTDTDMFYMSLNEAYDKLFTHVTSQSRFSHIQREQNFYNAFEYLISNQWVSLTNAVQW